MAKKKRRIVEEPEEEYEFTPTEFNEREFILKDIYGTKVFAVAMILGLIVGIVGMPALVSVTLLDVFAVSDAVTVVVLFFSLYGLTRTETGILPVLYPDRSPIVMRPLQCHPARSGVTSETFFPP